MALSCNKYCCCYTGFSLAIANACTANKLQGLEVGPDKQMNWLNCHLTTSDEKANPGIQNVLHSWCIHLSTLAFPHALTVTELAAIGFGPQCDMHSAELA